MRTVLAALLVVGTIATSTTGAHAYSYASPQSDPLIAQREAFLDAVNKGDWSAASAAVTSFGPDIKVLEAGDDAFSGDPGIGAAFTDAVKNKDSDAAKAALRRATVDQIERRLSGAESNIGTYQTASTLVVTAQAFYSAMAADLPAATQKSVSAQMQAALDAVGKPGVFGYGAKPADPAAFKAAKAAILSALKPANTSTGSPGGTQSTD